STQAPLVEPLVVALPELSEAVQFFDRFGAGGEVTLQFDGNLTIGNHLLATEDRDAVPAPPVAFQRIESLDLERARRSDVVIETQLGRFVVPARLVNHLHQRRATTISLMAGDGFALLSASGDISAPTSVPTIVAM